MQLKQSIYFHSPIFLQNILTTIYGRVLYQERYGPVYQKRLQELKEKERFRTNAQSGTTGTTESISTVLPDVQSVLSRTVRATPNQITASSIGRVKAHSGVEQGNPPDTQCGRSCKNPGADSRENRRNDGEVDSSPLYKGRHADPDGTPRLF